jgi:hypothetical protein
MVDVLGSASPDKRINDPASVQARSENPVRPARLEKFALLVTDVNTPAVVFDHAFPLGNHSRCEHSEAVNSRAANTQWKPGSPGIDRARISGHRGHAARTHTEAAVWSGVGDIPKVSTG